MVKFSTTKNGEQGASVFDSTFCFDVYLEMRIPVELGSSALHLFSLRWSRISEASGLSTLGI